MELSLIPLQHMWIHMNTCTSKQGLREFVKHIASTKQKIMIEPMFTRTLNGKQLGTYH
jgi:hypothetical protein